MSAQASELARTAPDPTSLAIIRRSLISLCNEMGATLARVAYSPVISDGLDFAGALFDPTGSLVACGDYDLTGLLGTLEPTVGLVLDREGDNLREGDVVMCNLPHEAGNHLNDIRLVRPVFADGALFALLADVGHWTDVGGATPGSINPLAADVYGEGLRIPPVKIVRRGMQDAALTDLVLANVRLRHEANGDLAAQLRALENGDARLTRVVERFGAKTVRNTFAEMQRHAGVMFEHELATIENGTVEAEDWIDGDPLDPERGPVRIHLRLTKSDGRLTADFSGSDVQPRAGIASTRPLTQSGVYVAILNLCPRIPFNRGFTEKVEIVTTPGSVVHAAFPAPVSGCASGGFEKVMACVLRAVGQLAPDKEVGCPYNLINVNLGGRDVRNGRPYVMYLWSEGGFGGGPHVDGGEAPTLTMYASGSRNQSVEVHERMFPVEFVEVALEADTAGAGRWRGGPGIRHAYRLTSGNGTIGVFGDRRRFTPWGVKGGLNGGRHGVTLNPGTERERDLGVTATGIEVVAGDVIAVQSGGGGGYGDPRDREPGRVLRDVVLGLVTPEVAERVYRVSVRCTDELRHVWQVDEEATTRLREVGAEGHDERRVT
jgi:N-methylhydantoinase B